MHILVIKDDSNSAIVIKEACYMNFGKIVFAQVMQFIPHREFNDIVAKYRGNYRVRNLTCYDQLLVMCLAQYADKNSLRDIEASLNALAIAHKLYHCGISYVIPRNTLTLQKCTK